MGSFDMTIFGERILTSFARKHADARKPLARFLTIVEQAQWVNAQALKQTFPAADLGKRTGVTIFDIGGNNYRLTAFVNYESQQVAITGVFTHAEYEGLKL
jgi:mRNA interferase HigB